MKRLTTLTTHVALIAIVAASAACALETETVEQSNEVDREPFQQYPGDPSGDGGGSCSRYLFDSDDYVIDGYATSWENTSQDCSDYCGYEDNLPDGCVSCYNDPSYCDDLVVCDGEVCEGLR